MKILVSACLLGCKCKYNGSDNFNETVAAFTRGHEVIPVCPEVAGGLPVPRIPCEIAGGEVISRDGESKDREFRKGAELCLSLAVKNGIDMAILQSRSPSCGLNRIYDGTFSGRLTQGSGVFASMLQEKGFRVFDVEELEKKQEKTTGNSRNIRIDISWFSGRFNVRCLNYTDIEEIYSLCSKNPQYYQYCPPFVMEESIVSDMKALPPGKDYYDKYYIGYFDSGRLIAVMDFIMAYPDKSMAFIGFFMTDVSVQNKGVGSGIISELCRYLKDSGLYAIRLGWVSDNPQAKCFWRKNGFAETGVTYDTELYTVTVAERRLI